MFALVDCNNFYVSCERVFNPSLNGKPVIVLSNNDGCVIARSDESKKLGIRMGQPYFELQSIVKTQDVRVFSSNYALYGDMSQRVMTILSAFAPDCDIYSIDEAFLSFKGFDLINISKYAHEIRATVLRSTGIPVSVGVGATKTLAKMANNFAKKKYINEGVFIVNGDNIEQSLIEFPMESIWGIGRQHSKQLIKYNINNAFKFANADTLFIRKLMSVVGVRIQEELKGYECIEIETVIPAKKSICTSRSFGSLQSDYTVVKEAVANFAAACARKLRFQNSCAQSVMVFIQTNNFRKDLPQFYGSRVFNFDVATSSTFELVKATTILVKGLFVEGYNYKKAGVIVSGIVPSVAIQSAMFDNINRKAHKVVLDVVDEMNNKYGKDKIKLASLGNNPKWKLKHNRLSPFYTTNWSDIIQIKV